jgi:ABC-type spermidine/putrescine transport system permease subunit II
LDGHCDRQSLLPVATSIIAASLRGISDAVLRAAVSLGACRWQVFADVVLPMALHGILSAAALSFLIAFDELLVVVFLSTPSLQTLPVRVYQAVQYELTPVVAVVSVLLMACLSCGVILGELYRWVASRTTLPTAASPKSSLGREREPTPTTFIENELTRRCARCSVNRGR